MKASASEQLFSRLNRILLILIVMCNAYVVLSPFMPELSFQLRQVQVSTPHDIRLQELDVTHNYVVIPRLGMTEKILEGDSIDTVNQGVWRRPATSTPAKGGNTVLVGHRFTYDGASVFYHLDKVAVGDEIQIIWNGSVTSYRVAETKVVPATAIEIEEPTEDERLTLYTCTPIWTAVDRLVLVAYPETDNE